MKLVILGNGFDLHHGYKTSFSDFRNHLLKSKKESDKKLITDIDIVLKSQKVNLEEGILWNDFERIIGKIMQSGSKTKKIEDIQLLSLAENFTHRFYDYLIQEVKKTDFILNKNINKEIQNSDLILTFNYTNSYIKYLKNNNLDIFHIHGELIEHNLPLIGFYYSNVAQYNYTDYLQRYNGKAFHKPALAYKQNGINLEKKISQFQAKWSSKISEVVIIGYSFGESDSHIYNILNTILVNQNQSEYIPFQQAKEIPVINFKLFNYNILETNKLIDRLKEKIFSESNRRSSVYITCNGTFSPEIKDIITFKIIDY